MGTDKEQKFLAYLRNELSDIERKKLDLWINEDPSNSDELEQLTRIWNTPIGYPSIVNLEDEQKKIWNRLQSENDYSLDPRKNNFAFSGRIFRYAAAIVLFIGLGYIFWENYQPAAVEAPAVTETIERVNPLGQKSRIQLPDGSNVWLNAGSKLSYTSTFGENSRNLQLKGEAYFEVTENPDKPFQVYTDNLVVTALGTSFNVCAFGDKKIEKVALNTGKVKLVPLSSDATTKPTYLIPGNLATLDVNSKKIAISQYNGLDPFGWKDGRIVFNDATFQEVIDVLSRWYNVKFEVKGTLKQDWHYGTTFEDEILVNIMESLKFSEKIDYELDGAIVTIKL